MPSASQEDNGHETTRMNHARDSRGMLESPKGVLHFMPISIRLRHFTHPTAGLRKRSSITKRSSWKTRAVFLTPRIVIGWRVCEGKRHPPPSNQLSSRSPARLFASLLSHTQHPSYAMRGIEIGVPPSFKPSLSSLLRLAERRRSVSRSPVHKDQTEGYIPTPAWP